MSIIDWTRRTSGARRARRLGAPVAACGLAIALGACGGSDADTAAAAGTIGADDQPATIEVVGDDYSFTGLPEEIVAGTTLTLRNDSDTELHELVAVRLPDDEERSAAALLKLPPEEFAAIGPPTAVILAPPEGGNILPVGTGTFDEPGRYVLFCSIPVGADPAEYVEAAATSDGPPQVDGGPPHFVEGMWGELTVIAG